MNRSLALSCLGAATLLSACPSNNNCPATSTGTSSGSSTSSTSSGSSSGTTSGAAIGGPLIGPTDDHCWYVTLPNGTVTFGAVDGGGNFFSQPTNISSCDVLDGGLDFNEDAGPPGPEYGPTNYNTASNDDDCKYAVSWRSTDISKNANVTFWFTTLYATNGQPVTGMAATPDGGPAIPSCVGSQARQLYFEVAGDPDGGLANHVNPNTINGVPIQEVSPGSGIYQIGPAPFFDESGLWYVRFHFNENCCDVLPDSPHGHAAFYINVP